MSSASELSIEGSSAQVNRRVQGAHRLNHGLVAGLFGRALTACLSRTHSSTTRNRAPPTVALRS